jgi:hypothetical protein
MTVDVPEHIEASAALIVGVVLTCTVTLIVLLHAPLFPVTE